MTPEANAVITDTIRRWFIPRPTISPSQWAQENLILPPSEERGQGPLSWLGREYAREIADDFADPDVEDSVSICGSQLGKTVAIESGVAYLMACDPCGVLWVLPDIALARSFSSKRWMPLIQNCQAIAPFIPRGAQRHDWAKLEQEVNGCVVNFVGSNSRSGLSSRPKRVVVLDEMDKFPAETRGGEAGAINLAEQRVKDAARPKRIKTSTPSTSDGPGWTQFLRGDQRRYLVPCPHCQKGVFLAWSKEHTILRIDGREAWMKWDSEARREDGTWDYDRVRRSARCECPHCGGHIQDHHKTLIVREGQWVSTAVAPVTFRSRHMPSLYASSPGTSFGALAQQFLELKRSIEGLLGFVNGVLAEPSESQDAQLARTEIVLQSADSPVADAVVRILSVDVQRSAPSFYWVVREFDSAGTGHSRRIGVGTCEEWEQLEQVQREHGIENARVVIDSGDGFRTQEVYDECCRRGTDVQRTSKRPLRRGWIPAKGAPKDARWVDAKTGQNRLFGLSSAPLPHTQFELPLFQFSGPAVLDILAKLRMGPDRAAGIRWEVVADERHDKDYWWHMDAKYKKTWHQARTGRAICEWWKRSKTRPDHWLDCEIQCLAFAMMLRLFPFGKGAPQPDSQASRDDGDTVEGARVMAGIHAENSTQ